MPDIRAVGIDWATEPKNRALAELSFDSTPQTVTLAHLICPLETSVVVRECRDTNNHVVAVDIPFGWPKEFTAFASQWNPGQASPVPDSASIPQLRLSA